MIPSESIHVIKTISDCQSFANAAKVLNKVPSAISYTVKRLEETLNIQLFDRSNKTVVLTAAGEHLVNRGNIILRDLDILSQELQQVSSGMEPKLKISFNNILNQGPIIDFLKDFTNNLPNTEAHIVREVYEGSWDSLFYGDVDLAIGTPDAMPPGGGYSTQCMGQLKWFFCTSPTHPLASESTPISNDLASQYPTVLIEDTSRVLPKRISWHLFKQKTIHVPDWKSTIEVIKSGLGVGYLPQYFAQYYIDNGDLIEKKLLEEKMESLVYIAWKTNNKGLALRWCLDYFNKEESMLENLWMRYHPEVSSSLQIP